MPRHLLYGRQVDAQVEQIPDPGASQIVRRRRQDLGLEAALPADPPGAAGAETSQLIAFSQQAPGLEHRTKERPRLQAASLATSPRVRGEPKAAR
jgi:hypothetical protein